jgi:hypothetical protein
MASATCRRLCTIPDDESGAEVFPYTSGVLDIHQKIAAVLQS